MTKSGNSREPETLEEWRDAYFAVMKARNKPIQNNAPRTERMDLHDELDERFPLFEDFRAFADAGHPEDAPGGPWEQSTITPAQIIIRGDNGWIKRVYLFSTEAEAIAVRDALNRLKET